MVGAVVLSHRIPEIRARPDQRLRSLARRAQRFIREAVDISIAMIRGGDALLIGGSVGYFAFDVASLGASFEALGGGALPVGLFVLAYVLGHGGAIVPIPGSAEGGLVGAFTLYGSPLSLAVGGDPRLPHLPRRGADDPGDRRPRRHPQAAPGGPRPGEIAKSFEDEGSLER